MSEILDKAQALLALNPLPADAEEQLDALYMQADEAERFAFDGLYEALFVKMSEMGIAEGE